MTATVYAVRWYVWKPTPKGVWLISHPTEPYEKKLVIHEHIKKWAYPTRAEAWQSFKKRLSSRRGHWETEGKRISALEKLVREASNA